MFEEINRSTEALDREAASCCSSESCCAPQAPVTRSTPKVGRNDPCPCGNGKKFKKCCGKNL
ncbi:SEC-C metal-binding domain-containing protein [Microbulbifer elongatus]|uniref:SEC-C metal-binding domain-containing protein n=1 Tax=Microbulbifer elongatus TaxID=86173 RepID=UPI001E5A800E|nr:SEC-C metal-binding domain-containing protein [Microbulbifer elongatus]